MQKKSTKLDFKTSYGSKRSRICPFSIKKLDALTSFRVAIGYEDTMENVISGLSEIIETDIKIP